MATSQVIPIEKPTATLRGVPAGKAWGFSIGKNDTVSGAPEAFAFPVRLSIYQDANKQKLALQVAESPQLVRSGNRITVAFTDAQNKLRPSTYYGVLDELVDSQHTFPLLNLVLEVIA